MPNRCNWRGLIRALIPVVYSWLIKQRHRVGRVHGRQAMPATIDGKFSAACVQLQGLAYHDAGIVPGKRGYFWLHGYQHRVNAGFGAALCVVGNKRVNGA